MNRARSAGLGFVVASVLAAQARALPREPIAPPPLEPGIELSFISADPIPRDGAIGLKFKLAGDPAGREASPIVQLSRADPNDASSTTTFAGTLRQVADGYWAWKADAPLEPGSYAFSAAHIEIGTMTIVVEVVDRFALEPPEVLSEQTYSSLAWTFVVTEYAACRYSDSAGGFFEGTPFPILEEGHLLLQTRLALEPDQQAINQFLYRTFVGPFDFTPFRAASELLESGPLTPRVGEHCAQVEALSLSTGDVVVYPGVQVCASYAGGEDLREQRVITANNALSRYNCMRPPEGYEEAWCKDNEQCINIARTPGIIDVNNCHDYFDICPDAERPDAGTAGALDAGSGVTTAPDAGKRDAGELLNEGTQLGDAGADDPADGRGSSGCAAAPTGATGRSPWVVGFFLVAGAVLARARRRC